MDYVWLVKHPYTVQAKEAVKKLNPELTDDLLIRAQDRLIHILTKEPRKIEYVSENQAKDGLILCPVIRLITSQISYNITQRVARTFSKMWTSFLKQEDNSVSAVQLLNIPINKGKMRFTDYVINIPDDHKLVNMPLKDGVVDMCAHGLSVGYELPRTFLLKRKHLKRNKKQKNLCWKKLKGRVQLLFGWRQRFAS